jgi:predicted oxidoreductase (fatty acid repression mutant protein)
MFMGWEIQANAMLQFQVWTGLCNLGYGVNIQHYNPMIDKEVSREFAIPNNWKLISQMPIGRSLGIYPKLRPCVNDKKVLIRK